MTTQYREVSRKAAVGERIKVVVGGSHGDRYHNVGDEHYVIFADRWSNGTGVSVSERNYVATRWDEGTGINHDRYVVLEPLAPAAPTPLSDDPLYAAFRQFVADNAAEIRVILPQLEAPGLTIDSAGSVKATGVSVSKPLTRAQVIAKATADVAELLRIGRTLSESLTSGTPFAESFFTAEFHVNREKRTVTALVSTTGWGGNIVRRNAAKFTAKCSPADVFHAEIGKAIALRRALGLTVPGEYVNAPKPDEPRVGAVVTDDLGSGVVTELCPSRFGDHMRGLLVNGGPDNGGFWTYVKGECACTVIDDTDVDYSAAGTEAAA